MAASTAAPYFFYRRDRRFHVPHIVQRIENTHDVDAVFDGFPAECIHNIIRVMSVAQKILPPQEHLQPCVGQRFSKHSQPLPRILLQKTHAGIECGASPAFDGPISDAVEHLAGGKHVLEPHPRRRLTLVSVAKYGVGDQQGLVPFKQFTHQKPLTSRQTICPRSRRYCPRRSSSPRSSHPPEKRSHSPSSWLPGSARARRP